MNPIDQLELSKKRMIFIIIMDTALENDTVPEFQHQDTYFLCAAGMIFCRYMAWRCRHFRLSIGQLVGELENASCSLLVRRRK
ncbi:MAG: hypothetical protein GIS02_02535 [Methanosarcinales archaeon]|uniref:Uncharacterized protein n=1 Tax=Candidatus Ethanoperedens thermophilum TaxID=2766897 RepID=A0A848D935_9EURY|nr:hypothetical protein [Candidatus Ethanoperedens thermophilum]